MLAGELGLLVEWIYFLFSRNDSPLPSFMRPVSIYVGSAARIEQDLLDKQIVGGKGLGLQVMGNIGIDVPPGTSKCRCEATLALQV